MTILTIARNNRTPITYYPVLTFLPTDEGMRLVVHHDVFVFQWECHTKSIHRQHPFLLAGILHPQIARRVPTADGGMAAADGYRLTGQQLRGGDAEGDGAAEQRQADGLHMLVRPTMNRRQVGVGIEMGGQRQVAPLVGEDIVLRRIEMIDTGHQVPFATDNLAVGILHLIDIDDVRQRMLARLQDGRLQRPQLTVVGLHHEMMLLHRAVLTAAFHTDIQAFAPCRPISNAEL